jgi:pimeloyl-ACP methyl ester carboxylesterase
MQHILLLHGAIGSKDQLSALAGMLENKFHVHSFNFSGHSGRPFPAEPFSIPLFSNQIAEYMQENAISKTHIFGYSMGGYAAMYLAKQQPEKISSLITLATKFHWDEATASKEVKMLDANTIQEKVPAFAAQLQERHAPNDWKELLEKTKQMLLGLGSNNALSAEDYSSINTPCLVMLGDRDKMVTLDETVSVYKKLPKAQLAVLPGTPHPLEQVDADMLASAILKFTGHSS